MHLRGAAASLLLTALLLSGCSSGGAGGKPDAFEQGLDELDLKATDTTGVIRGVVVDAAIVPLAGVAVSVRSGEVNLTKETGEDGLFGFDGLAPGEYFLYASKEGFTAAQSSATVVAGVDDPPIVKIALSADQSTLPFYEERVYEAFIGCSITSPTVSAAVCDMHDSVKEATNNEFLVSYDAVRPPSWIQSEAVWDSSQPAGDDLSLSLTDFQGEVQRTVADAAGKSPIFFTVNATVAAEHNYGVNNSLVIRLFSTKVEGTDNVQESTFQDPYKDSVYGPLNSTGAPQAYEDTVVANDPTCIFPFCTLSNPFGSEECIKDPVLFDSCFDVGGAGVVVNQRVTVFTHVFYGYTPDDGWRFSETNSVPLPPQ